MNANDWAETLKAEEKAHEDYRNRATKVVERYEDETKREDSKFNILWSNVETLHPAVYSKTPTPDIRRRYLDRDPDGKKAAEIAERAASYALDVYDFDGNVGISIDDYLLTAFGQVRLRYEPYIDEKEGETRPLQEMLKGYDELNNPLFGMFDGDSEVEEWQTGDDGFAYVQDDPYEELVYEEVICEPVNWKRFRWQPAARWEDVDWCAIEHYFDDDELKERYPDDHANIPLTYKENGVKAEADEKNAKALIYEIFDKKNRKNIEIADGYDEILKEEEDPLGLEGYYPFPRPLTGTMKNGKFIPIPDYLFYQDQAKELDRLTQRIDKLTEQLKYRGVYDASITEMRNLEQAEDGEFIPISDASKLMTGNQLDLKKALAVVPTEEIIRALKALHESREETKQVIYEITGISDIVRGSTSPSETLGAQQLKTQFGSMRLGSRQKKVARFVRDILRLKVEIMVENFQPETLSMMTGVDIVDGDPVHRILTNDLMRSYRIDIETDSTIAEDAVMEKQNRIELVTAITGFFEKVGPMVQAGVLPQNIATELLGFAVRGFKVGRTLEDTLDEMSSQDEDPRMVQMQGQFKQAQEQMKQQAMQAIEGVKQQAGKEIQRLQGKLFEAEKKHAITGAVNEAKMFETQTKAEVSKATDKYKTDLQMLLEVFRAEIQQNQQAPIQRMDEVGALLQQFAQIMASQDEQYRGEISNLQGQIIEAKSSVEGLGEMMKKPVKVIRDAKGRVTGAARE